MKILTGRIETLEGVGRSTIDAIKSDRTQASAGLSFVSYAEMYRILFPKRLDIIRALAGQKALTFHKVARRVGRDFKGAHPDLAALIAARVIDRKDDVVVFSYETIHFDFDIQANAA